MKTIAIYGAGPALGMAVARRFGSEGFQVALVARRREALDGMVSALSADGIEAAGFQADIADPAEALRAADEIEDRFGTVDVLEHSPTPAESSVSPLDIDPRMAAAVLDLYVLTPIALANRMLPGMRERADGALLFAMGAAAKYPTGRYAAPSVALPALRGYIHTLNAAARDSGIYAGALLIGALIEGSHAHRESQARTSAGGGASTPVIAPSDLADRLWNLAASRDRVEDVIEPAFSRTSVTNPVGDR
ncbi:MAG: SDR family NAD(P)-dependent oxidoreductase [Catenulispora sp.]